ncbi:AAA family ATPase [Caenispirillum salinarum]|uniref:AAA family ATPase n=1 Tax=Caenispirillum salinarum TaxID=859058 RepID=UPI001F259238|nr:AAA family ATPase [Caenispirillum salinarum]
MDRDRSSDLAWSWASLAALRGHPIAQQGLVAELRRRAAAAHGLSTSRYRRVVLSWADHVTLADLHPGGPNSSRLYEALTEAVPNNPASRLSDGLSADALLVLKGPLPDDNREDKYLSKAWQSLTQPLPLASPPPLEILRAVLDEEFPWLKEAIAAVLADLQLHQWAGCTRTKWRPLLLVGPPGTGKTRFARRLGELTGAGFGEVNAAGSSDNRALQGTARGYSSASPSQVLHVMRRTKTANPVILVDEIDKAQGSQNGDIRQTLLTMLEPESAKSWPDECLCVPCDLSAINWVLCANDVSRLRGPLLSRLRVVQTPQPEHRHLPAVLAGIQRDLWLVIAPHDLPELDPQHVDAFAHGLRRGVSLRRIAMAYEKFVQNAQAPKRLN